MQTFKEWVVKYKGKDNIRGDFAEDILRDKNFPDTNDKDKILSYVEFQLRHHGNSKAFPTFKRMYDSYLKSLKDSGDN